MTAGAPLTHQLTLTGHPAFRTWRNIWMLEELGVPYTLVPINPRATADRRQLRQINPHVKIPCLQDDDFVLCESAAINTYLGDKFGRFVPSLGTRQRALYDQWCFFIMSELDAQSLYIHRKHVQLSVIYGEAPQAVTAAQEYFVKHISVAAQKMERQRVQMGGMYLLGESFTAVDILMTHVLMWAQSIGWLPKLDHEAGAAKPQVAEIRTLLMYLQTNMERPACRRTMDIANTTDTVQSDGENSRARL